MSSPGRRRSVLITGCSSHGLGHALALAFHDAGLRVFATARDESRMSELQDRGIECLRMDVVDEDSVRACVDEVRRRTGGGSGKDGEGEGEERLDCLVNNAGGGYNMPVSDISLPEAKSLFDLNVWSPIVVTQAFLPLLMAGTTPTGPPCVIINNTSISSIEPTPHNSVYHASKAAAAMFSTHMRLELQPFNVHVIDLKTGCVHSNFHANHQEGRASLPEGSLYASELAGPDVRLLTENAMRNAFPHREDPEVWAKAVVRDVLGAWDRKMWFGGAGRTSALPLEIWRGTGAWRTWFYNCTVWPTGWWDEWWRRAVGLDLLRERVRKGYGA